MTPAVPRSAPTSDAYRLLGVQPGVDDATLKAAYRARIRATHPDLVALEGDAAIAQAETRTKALNEAYEAVKRERQRAARGPSRQRTAGTPPNAHEALRAAQVAVGLAETCVKRWHAHTRALRRARAAVLAEQARLAQLPGAAPAPDNVDSEIRAAAAAVVDARLTQPIVALAGHDRAAARQRFATTETARILAVAAEAEAAARVIRDRVARQANRADGQLRRLASCAERAQEAGRSARRAARALAQEVPAARSAVEAAMVAAARAAGLARVEAGSAGPDGAMVARRNQERAAALLAQATRLERQQLVGEEEAATATERARAIADDARAVRDRTAHPEVGVSAWQTAARAARAAFRDAVERALAEAEAAVQAALAD